MSAPRPGSRAARASRLDRTGWSISRPLVRRATTSHRSSITRTARYYAFGTTAACRRTTRSSVAPGFGPRSTRTATAISYGLTFHPATGQVFDLELGPLGGDKVSIILPGRNYGWPLYSYGRDNDSSPLPHPNREGIEPALITWQPGIAPQGMTFYTGDRFPNWKGQLFIASIQRGRTVGTGGVERVVFNEKLWELRRETMFTDLKQRVRDVRAGPRRIALLHDRRRRRSGTQDRADRVSQVGRGWRERDPVGLRKLGLDPCPTLRRQPGSDPQCIVSAPIEAAIAWRTGRVTSCTRRLSPRARSALDCRCRFSFQRDVQPGPASRPVRHLHRIRTARARVTAPGLADRGGHPSAKGNSGVQTRRPMSEPSWPSLLLSEWK